MQLTRSSIPALLSAVLGIALYAVSIPGTYIYDDLRLLVDDTRVREPSQWGRYWTESYNGSVDTPYRPLASMSYAIQWWLHGDRPWAFHLVNVLLHGGVCAIVAELARRLSGDPRLALVGGLLFAAHPIHVEAVANIAGRPELMCAAGMFGAFLLYLKPLTRARAVAIAGCFVLAILSKEQGMLVPPLLWVLAKVDRITANPPPEPAKPGGRILLPVLLVGALLAYVVVRQAFVPLTWDRTEMDWTVNPMVPGPANPHGGSVGRDAWLMPVVLLGRYTALLVAPVKLSMDYGATVIGWSAQLDDRYLYIGLLALAAWGVAFYISVRRRSALGIFATVGLAMTYGMVGNIAGYIGTIFGERLMYMPSAFMLLLVAGVLVRLKRQTLLGAMSVLLILASVRTVTYAQRWNEAFSFYERSLAEQPESMRLRMLVAQQYVSRGDFQTADRLLAEGRAKWPDAAEIWVYSAIMAMEQRRFDDAQAYLTRAAQLHPTSRTLTWINELNRRRAAAGPSTAR